MTEQFVYVECDVPEDMTLAEHRRSIAAANPKRRYRPWRGFCETMREMTAWMRW